MKLALMLLILSALPCRAAPVPIADDAARQREAVIRFLEGETRGIEGEITIEIPEAGLPGARRPCAAPSAFLAVGRRAWGRITVGLRCASPSWTLFVPARIKVVSDYPSAARPLAPGTTLQEADIRMERGDIAALPAGTLTRREQALGRTLRMAVAGGVALRTDQFQPVYAIARGQKVRVISRGETFEVSNEGEALSAAIEGQTVQVRLGSGRIVQGLARPGGIVEVLN